MNKKKFAMSLSAVAALGAILTGCGTANSTSGGGNSSGNTSSQNSTATGASKGSKTITIGWIPWTEDVANTHLWKVILEQKGYKVNTPELDVGPLLLGMSKNSVNFFMDLWMPAEQPNVKKYQSKLVALKNWYKGESSTGIAVPSYMKNINTPADLNKHAKEFQNRIVGIDPGAIEEKHTHQFVKTYHLTNIHVQDSSTTAMITAVKRAYDQHKPVAVVMWTPMWPFTKYHLKYLKDPKHIVAEKTPNKLLIEANKTWVKNNPKVAGWLKNFSLTAKQLSSLEEDMRNSSSKDAAAKKWIKANQSLVDSWLK
ncbi:glycine betaine ABC transporter substrate-binding protein [Alicyclobacillus sp. SO9]|uniref:glycine betaine ABC transporter substrate-binding protein n=1 Tax=Alicyclobacillus sp. SO9 TaxID=2665646 RepID=UPI0018E8AE9D|nr:glycine betaine ABC transporter substrate-binding protein [Alicyclobacillus sp. SO9]QQE79121.1 glycine betaine ABC transporter substrate-binding protein [Alicyclobacillus sp. SO9]